MWITRYHCGPFLFMLLAVGCPVVAQSAESALCLRLDFSPPTAAPDATYTYDEVCQQLAQVSDAVRVLSYGKTWLVSTVTTQTLVLPKSKEYYTTNAYEYNCVSLDLARSAGYSPASYDLVFYWAATGSGGGAGDKGVWLSGRTGADSIVHEMGHIYGAMHANYWLWQTGVGLLGHRRSTDGAASEHIEYGDLSDNMGFCFVATNYQCNANLKAAMNWLEPQDIAVASTNGIYRIYRFDHADARSVPGRWLALRARNRDGEEFWASLREALIGEPFFHQSACIVWTPRGPNSHELLDTTPLSAINRSVLLDRADAALAVGKSWTDPTGSLRIKNLGGGGRVFCFEEFKGREVGDFGWDFGSIVQ